MPGKKIAALGWENCAHLFNDRAEVLITLDVGPRILTYKLPGAESVLRVFPDQLGKTAEKNFIGRGGHRLWASPENDRTYAPDNNPVQFEFKDPNAVHLTNPPTDPWRVRKEMTVLSDDRWKLGRRFFVLEPKKGRPATKLGLVHRERWVGYVLPRSLFIKAFDFEDGALYPDLGCNFETFSNDDFIELETLSPLKELAPGQSVGHTETWHLFAIDAPPQRQDENILHEWFAPFISKLGIA